MVVATMAESYLQDVLAVRNTQVTETLLRVVAANAAAVHQ